jgi:hypothetical protein
MTQSTNNTDERRKKACERYDSQVAWYEKSKKQARIFFRLSQTLVIILSGITPVLILATDCKVVQAIPPAVASILAGVLGIFQWQEDWRRRGLALEALKSEFVKFDTRSGDGYDSYVTEDQAIERFILRMENIIANEVSEWQRRRAQTEKPSAT